MCSRYAYYEQANHIFENLSANLAQYCVQVEDSNRNQKQQKQSVDLNYISWLEFMGIMCKAEYLIGQANVTNVNEFICNLNSALQLYNRAQVVFKANCSRCFSPCPIQTAANITPVTLENSNTCIQLRFCELRAEQIKLFIHLILSTMTYQTIPAPVFHFKSAETFGKFGRIAQQMKYSLVEVQKLTQKYKELLSECFDADCHTLNVLNMLVIVLLLLFIHCIFLKTIFL